MASEDGGARRSARVLARAPVTHRQMAAFLAATFGGANDGGSYRLAAFTENLMSEVTAR